MFDIVPPPKSYEDALSIIALLDIDPVWNVFSASGLHRRLPFVPQGFGVIYLDVDSLHACNTKFTHIGVNIRMRQALQVRGDTLAGRWQWGDEIVLIAPVDDIRQLAYRMRGALRDQALSATFAVVANPNGDLLAAIHRAQAHVETAKAHDQRGKIFAIC